jgi:DNA-binding IclR family transcriptional regulator
MSDDLNMDVWLSALQEAMATNNYPGGRTVKELSEATGIPDRRVRVLIAKLIGQGRVKAMRTKAYAIDGRLTSVPAYIIINKEN